MRLKELRIEKGLKQSDVADALQTWQRNIGRWEREEVLPSSEYIVKLADFFGVSADYLLGRSDDLGYVTVQNTATALSADEQKILELYQTLSPSRKEDLKIYLRALSESSATNTQGKKHKG